MPASLPATAQLTPKSFWAKAQEPGAHLSFLEHQRKEQGGYLWLQEQQVNIAAFNWLAWGIDPFWILQNHSARTLNQQQQLSPLILLWRILKICHHLKQREIRLRHWEPRPCSVWAGKLSKDFFHRRDCREGLINSPQADSCLSCTVSKGSEESAVRSSTVLGIHSIFLLKLWTVWLSPHYCSLNFPLWLNCMNLHFLKDTT